MARGPSTEHWFQSGLCRDRPLEAGDWLPLLPPLWLGPGSPRQALPAGCHESSWGPVPGWHLSSLQTSFLSGSPGACSFGRRLWVPDSQTSPQSGPPPRSPPSPAARHTSKPVFSGKRPCHPLTATQENPGTRPTRSLRAAHVAPRHPGPLQAHCLLRRETLSEHSGPRAPEQSGRLGWPPPRSSNLLQSRWLLCPSAHGPCTCLPRLSQGSSGSPDSVLVWTLFQAVHRTAVSPAEHSRPLERSPAHTHGHRPHAHSPCLVVPLWAAGATRTGRWVTAPVPSPVPTPQAVSVAW